MLRVGRILRDYREAGAVNELLAVWGFVDDGTFLTKSGSLGVVYRLRGIDADGLTYAQRRSFAHHMEAALRLLDERYRLYEYLIKRNVDTFTTPHASDPIAQEALARRAAYLNNRRSDLYELSLFLVLLHEPPVRSTASTRLRGFWSHPRDALRAWLSTDRAVSLLQDTLDRAIDRLHHEAQAFETQLADLGPERLPAKEAFAFFRRLVNYEPRTLAAVPPTPMAHVDYFAADSPIECHRDHLLVGSRVVKVLSMKEPPSRTFAHVLGDLVGVSGELVACLEWQRIPPDRMRRNIHARRRHFFNRRVSLVNYVSPDTRPEEMLVDDSATATVKQLGHALTELEVNGHFFGACSLTLVLHGESNRAVQHQTAEAMKALAVHDGCFFEETYNVLNAWLSIVPGNSAHNLRRLALLETHVSDLSFLFTSDLGETLSPHLGQPPLAIFETPHRTPYAYNLHVGDVGHTLVLGATGSGKSFTLNFLVTHAQQYEPLTVILDLGHSYRKLTTLLQGRYLEIGLRRREVTINPFALDPTPEHLHFLQAFVRLLLEADDGYRLSALEDREVYEAVENLYVLDRSQRRLFTLANLLPRPLAARLHKWIEGGPYADLFDHVDDTLTLGRLQVFDFDAMSTYAVLLEPLLFYVLYRVTACIQDQARTGSLKLCVMDEAWRLIQHPVLRAYVEQALKTWRKHNAAMILATQTVDDFASVALLRTVVESCPTKLLLANPSLDRRQYAELFQLNEMELDLLADLLPRQQILLKRPRLTKVLTLNVDPRSYWLYTNTPVDNERVRAIFGEFGFSEGLDRLAASA
ncbi:MAG: VirB4 family type IV secretion system protein [Vicinamibacteraceae bacterium]